MSRQRAPSLAREELTKELAPLQRQALIRQALTVRLEPEAKALWDKHSAKACLEPGTAARVVLELMVDYMRSGPDFIDALYVLKNALATVESKE